MKENNKVMHADYRIIYNTIKDSKQKYNRFKPSSLKGSLVNIADDINANFLKDTGNYKTIDYNLSSLLNLPLTIIVI